jgi:3-hydroxy acid dehydrogenase/malonic semialdehyde reductase
MIVFVTGASVGIGESVARRYLREGAKVIVTARRLEKLEPLREEFGADRVLPLAMDVCDTEAVQRIVDRLPAAFAEVDVLVNNAGLALGLEPAHQARLDEWHRMVDTNIKGLLSVTRALLPGMVARKRGHIVNLGSVAGEWPYPGGNVYGGTKAFVRQFSLNLRADLLGSKVRVTDIEPGMTGGTEFSNVRFRNDDDKAAKVYANVEALGPDDVAEAIYWVTTLPPHVNINILQMMPVDQAFSAFAVHRGG